MLHVLFRRRLPGACLAYTRGREQQQVTPLPGKPGSALESRTAPPASATKRWWCLIPDGARFDGVAAARDTSHHCQRRHQCACSGPVCRARGRPAHLALQGVGLRRHATAIPHLQIPASANATAPAASVLVAPSNNSVRLGWLCVQRRGGRGVCRRGVRTGEACGPSAVVRRQPGLAWCRKVGARLFYDPEALT